MNIKRLMLFLKTRVSGYTTQGGVVVNPYYDKRPARRPKPTSTHGAPKAAATSQLNLFSLLDQPSTVAAHDEHDEPVNAGTEADQKAKLTRTLKTKPDPSNDRVTLDYDRPWADIEVNVQAFGAQADWTPATRKKANEEALTIYASGKRHKDWRGKLAAYSGTGGIGDSLNEYYTPPKVAAAMWYLLRRFGLERGHVCEPAAGTGVFQETKPAGVTMTAVEWDPTSAGINAVLHPEDEVVSMATEHFVSADPTRYDAIIGNVPFGTRGAIAGFDKPHLGKAEDYFVDTCLDKTKDGGLVCLVVPHGIATNATSRSFRKRVMGKAEVVGLHRLPNTAFKHSGTAVVTDILLLRKRRQDVANALGVLEDADLKKVGVWDQPWVDGKILGDPVRGHLHGTAQTNWRGGDDVAGDMDHVPAAVATTPIPDLPDGDLTMADVAKALEGKEEAYKKALRAANKNPYPELATGTTKLINGELYILQGEPRRWHRAADVGHVDYDPSTKEGQALALGERLKEATAAARDGLPISNLDQLRTDVQAYIAQHGNPGGDATLAAMGQRDPRFLPLMASVTGDGRLSDLLEGKTLAGARAAAMDWTNLDEVAAHLMEEDRRVTVAELAKAWEGEHTDEDTLRHLYASDRYAASLDGSHWGLREDLTAGDLYPKLDAHDLALRDMAPGTPLYDQLTRQRQWVLERIQPKTMEEFETSLRSGFIPEECLSDYLTFVAREHSGANGHVTVTQKDGVYTIAAEKGSDGKWLYVSGWYEKYLSRMNMREGDWDAIPAREAEFKDWLSTSDWRQSVEEGYNRSFNSFKSKHYGDAPVEVPGWNPDRTLNAYQHPAIRWALEEGKGILAYDVGLGKTAAAIAIVAKLKEQGKAKRPVVVVPKSVTANWMSEIEAFRPGSKVLVIGETHTRDKNGKLLARTDNKAERDKKWHLVTQNEYDYILVTMPAFNDIDVSPITKGEYVKEDFWVKRAGQMDKATDRQRREILERYEQAMADKDFLKRTNAIYWDQLGVDVLIGDEFHAYKNLFVARDRNGQKPKFLGGTGFAKRSLDMSHKAEWLRSQNGGKGIYALSATPTKNSPLELYSLLSHIAPEEFRNRGIRHEEDFIDRYCDIQQQQVLGTDGQIADCPVVTGFKNMDELRSVMGRYIYRKTAEDVGLQLPEKAIHEHFVDMTDAQEGVYQELRAQVKDSANETGDAHIFSVMDKMAKAAMDLSLYDPVNYADAPSPKYDQAAKTILANVKDGGQIVFADQVGVHEKMKRKLIEGGMDPNHIGIINAAEAPDSARRQNIADAFVNGTIKVVIGNTATMGEGVNLQKHTSDIHHLDIPWEPASIQQRNGRGLRQGNTLANVRLHTYLAKRSFDGYRWQTMSGKRDWMTQLWSGGDRIENPSAQQGVTSKDELLIMMSDNPVAAKEALEKDKDAQMAKYTAIKKTEAANTFRQYVKAKLNHAALKDKTTQTARMAHMRIDRLRDALVRHEHFHDKKLLDFQGPILLNRHGHPFHEGAAVLMEGGGKGPAAAAEPSTWTISHVDVEQRKVRMRPVGYAGTRPDETGETDFDLQDLESGVSPTDPVSAGAELRHVVEKLRHPVALSRYPRAMLEEHLPAIQDRLRAFMGSERNYDDPEDRRSEPLWGFPKGSDYLQKIHRGEERANEATYLVPNTDLMHKLYDKAIEEKEWNKRYGGSGRSGGYGRKRHTMTRYEYQGAMADFHEWGERDKVLEAYQKEKAAKQAGLAKSRVILKLRRLA